MKRIEKFFDINMVLMTVYSALEIIIEERHTELVYDIDPTIPKELKGDPESVTHILTQLLLFVFNVSDRAEVILSLQAPEDFLYEEMITFRVEDVGVSRSKADNFFQTRIRPALERLDAIASFDDEEDSISIAIPFKLNDLGNRRYYRLPDIGMLGKKVLLISQSKVVGASLAKMFRYFLYEVDVGAEAYKQRGSNLGHYDIFVLEDMLLTDGIETLVRKVQREHDLKFVILEDASAAHRTDMPYISAYLMKPVMQESIFELVIALFEGDIKERKIKKEVGKPIINMEKYILDAFEKSEKAYVEIDRKMHQDTVPTKPEEILLASIEEDTQNAIVLDSTTGKIKAKETGMDYHTLLKDFVDRFDRSDIYFRDIAKSKAQWQIKEFAIDLEKRARIIGAERVAKLAEKISLLFVYDNLDMLPVFSGKYHHELIKLVIEIKKYLDRTSKI